jgi:hypothetical protein
VPAELEQLAVDRIGYFKIADFSFEFDEIDVFERRKDRDDEGADEEAESYFFLERHD